MMTPLTSYSWQHVHARRLLELEREHTLWHDTMPADAERRTTVNRRQDRLVVALTQLLGVLSF